MQVDYEGTPTSHPQGLVPVEWAMFHGMWVLPSSTKKTYPQLDLPERNEPDDWLQVT